MSSVSKRTRDKAMRAIIDHSVEHPQSHITPSFLKLSGAIPRKTDPFRVADVLNDMGLISFENDDRTILIKLTPQGDCYFEAMADKKSSARKEHLHNWLIAIFSALAGALASEPLWSFIHKALDILHQTT